MATSTTTHLHVPESRTAAWIKAAAFAGAGRACALLLLYNLTDYPKTWFDEGSHLHVPKAFVLSASMPTIAAGAFATTGRRSASVPR